MFESIAVIVLALLGVALFVSPFIVNAYFQRKAERYTDELLEESVDEYNKQIKTNAVSLLVRRSLWGLIVLSGLLWNFRVVMKQGFNKLTVFVLIIGIACFAFGVWGYRSELKRLKPLK